MTDQILTLLIAERDKLNRAIEALQGPTAAKRRGRPPKNPLAPGVAPTSVAATAPSKAKKKARTFSAAQKEEASERMKARWAAKRASEAKAARKSKKAAASA